MTAGFTEFQPSARDYWRGIVLFGRNVASFKFALASALLEIGRRGEEIVSIDAIALPHARSICAHSTDADKQSTAVTSQSLNACRSFNRGGLNEDARREATVRFGFNNVIDAFPVVGGGRWRPASFSTPHSLMSTIRTLR
jgi:hypothetical protein